MNLLTQLLLIWDAIFSQHFKDQMKPLLFKANYENLFVHQIEHPITLQRTGVLVAIVMMILARRR